MLDDEDDGLVDLDRDGLDDDIEEDPIRLDDPEVEPYGDTFAVAGIWFDEDEDED